jgi:hypothetical protein
MVWALVPHWALIELGLDGNLVFGASLAVMTPAGLVFVLGKFWPSAPCLGAIIKFLDG